MSVFNTSYNSYRNFEPVNLYNWEIEFILDGDAYGAMNDVEYITYNKDSVEYKGDDDIIKDSYYEPRYETRKYSWQEQSDILTFMCKKCNLPKKKINEVNTYCMGLKASFNAGINIDSSLSLSFDETSNRMVSKILTRLSNFYSSSNFIRSSINNGNTRYARLNKVALDNANEIMVNGSLKPNSFNEYLTSEEDIEEGRLVNKANNNNRDLTIKVKMFRNKYGYYRPNEYLDNDKPIQEFIFYKCFINNLNYGDGYDYSSEENVNIDCEIIYNWYTSSNIITEGNIGDMEILQAYKIKQQQKKK